MEEEPQEAGSPQHPRGRPDHDRIVEAIRRAESASTGQICVQVSGEPVRDVGAAARREFARLGMAATTDRNAVLIFVAPRARKFAVVGDAGVHERCGDDFWRATAAAMEKEFRAGRLFDGIVEGVRRVGEALAGHFPVSPGD